MKRTTFAWASGKPDVGQALEDLVRGRGRALSASDAVGMRVLLVHALDDNARGFYERSGVDPSPTDPLNLQMRVKDIPKSLA